MVTADLFVSVDGFAAGRDCGPYFGYGGPELQAWIDAELARPQTTLMGRATYELMASMGDGPMDAVPKAVVSSSLPVATWANTRLLRSVDEVGTVAGPVRTIGSLALVRSLLDAGLVDRLRLMTFPLTLGTDGEEPVRFPRRGLELASAEVFDGR